MAGSLTIPNSIGAQSGPSIAGALFDQNWAAIATYVNVRQVTFDLIANRPAAGVAGRYFYATNQSTFYLDNGTSWLTIAGGGPGGGSGPLPMTALQSSIYNSGNADQFTLGAARVCVVALAGTSAHFLSSVSVTVDRTVVGAGGRDQAAALTANSWGHLYFIYNPTTATANGLLSASAWPSASPTLPSGYTECTYAGAVRINGSSQFSAMAIRGRRSVWLSAQQVLTNGAASTATAIDCSAAIPPNADWCHGYATMRNTVAAVGDEYVFGDVLMNVTGGTPTPILRLNYALTASQAGADGGAFEGYPLAQQLYYKIVDDGGAAADGTNQLQVFVTSFDNPNGG